MEDSEFDGYKKAVLNIGQETTAEVCFNNGSGSWDSRNGSNYYLIGNQVGVTNGSVYLIQ